MKIKYDKRACKVLIAVLCGAGVLFLAGLACLLLKIDGTELFLLTGIYAGGGLTVYAGINLINALFYMRRLRAHGYEIPENRKDYNNDLNNVPVSAGSHVPAPESAGSKLLALLYLASFVPAVLYNVYYMAHWHRYLKADTACPLVLQMAADLFWLIYAFAFYRQRNNRKYRDDVERDPARKKRVSVERGLFGWAAMLAVTVVFKIVIGNLSDYVFHSRQEHDQHTVESIQISLTAAICAMDRQEGDWRETCDSYRQMETGCCLSQWVPAQDSFTKVCLEMLSVSDFTELGQKIYTSDGDPVIYVEIIDGQVYVQLKNPIYTDHGIQFPFEAGKAEP